MKIRSSIFAVMALGLAACSASQLSKGVDIANKTSEGECRVLVWGQPIIQGLSDSGTLDTNGQEILNDVNTVLIAGCDKGDTTAMARVSDVAKAMVAVIYAPHTAK